MLARQVKKSSHDLTSSMIEGRGGYLVQRRHRRKRGSRKTVKNTWVSARRIFLVGLFVISQALFFLSAPFFINKIHVLGEENYSSQEIIDLLGTPLGVFIPFADRQAYRDRVSSASAVETVEVETSFPSQLVVRITEKKPHYKIFSLKNPTLHYYLDADGWVLKKERFQGIDSVELKQMPQWMFDRKLRVGEQLPASLLEEGKSYQEMLKRVFGEKFYAMTLTSDHEFVGYVRLQERNVPIYLGLSERNSFKERFLSSLDQHLKKEPQKLASIDLKFRDPVVKKVVVKKDPQADKDTPPKIP